MPRSRRRAPRRARRARRRAPARPRQRPSRKVDTERPALGPEAHGLDRRGSACTPDRDEELPYFVLVQPQHFRTDRGRADRQTAVEQRSSAGGPVHVITTRRAVVCVSRRSAGVRVTRSARSGSRPAPAAAGHRPRFSAPARPEIQPCPGPAGGRACGNGTGSDRPPGRPGRTHPAPEELPVLGSSTGVETTRVQPQRPVDRVVVGTPSGPPPASSRIRSEPRRPSTPRPRPRRVGVRAVAGSITAVAQLRYAEGNGGAGEIGYRSARIWVIGPPESNSCAVHSTISPDGRVKSPRPAADLTRVRSAAGAESDQRSPPTESHRLGARTGAQLAVDAPGRGSSPCCG